MAEWTDYRALLGEEYSRRQEKNPAYSYRAFARDMGISPSFLSKVLKKQKRLAEERAFHIASLLHWNAKKTKIFVTSVRHDQRRSEAGKAQLRQELDSFVEVEAPFRDIPQDTFAAISQWYHMAILALTELDGFADSARKSRPGWMAERLGITAIEAELAIDRLKRMGLLKEQGGILKQTDEHFFVADTPSRALRAYHHQILQKAMRSISEQTIESRDISGSTIPMDPARVPEANDAIRRFRRELMALMSTGPRKALYHLSVQLFRLDKETGD